MQTVTAKWLHTIDQLQDVPEAQLQWVIDNSTILTVKEGELFVRPGTPSVGAYILISGKMHIYDLVNQEMRDVTTLEPKAISGYLPFSRGTVSNVYVEATADSALLLLPKEKFREMISGHFELTQALVHVMTNRIRSFTSLQQQDEKMMALGKLSAGLTHELNNPAAAIVRSSATLLEHLRLQPEDFKEIMAIRMEEKEVDAVSQKLWEVLDRTDKPVLTLMEQTELEDEITGWLEKHQVQRAAEIAENFIEDGFTCDDLRDFKAHIPVPYLSPVFNWINSNLVTRKMVADINEASRRISDLVKSVKNFTHMDQGKGKELTDIRDGIRNTLTMLHYRFKKENVTLIEDYDQGLPRINAMVSELNQVWTNLIDNALDAMEPSGHGQLTIRTEKEHDWAKTSIIDNGPGIPAEIQSRIFEPFFTTKDIGKGTGLGLDVVCRIVKQHHGSIRVQSKPGETIFVVCFPINGGPNGMPATK
ncbi:MAG TPA: ATP-binding protein [Puia sp.]|jgi:signal transduction histidine kinase|nr:ATP-binding protein [Puia sp.]